MTRLKVERGEEKTVVYTTEHWELLETFRRQALAVAEVFAAMGFDTLTFGSVARGDVKPSSDVDIILTSQLSTYRVELALEQAGQAVIGKKIIQATPNDVIKAHFDLEGNTCLTVLLTDFTRHPFEFYRFGGALDYKALVESKRTPGIDKRLMVISPHETGHHEYSLLDRPHEAAKKIGVSQATVDQRIRVLSRRDKVGRTGVFINEEVPLEADIEDTLRALARDNPLIRRRLAL